MTATMSDLAYSQEPETEPIPDEARGWAEVLQLISVGTVVVACSITGAIELTPTPHHVESGLSRHDQSVITSVPPTTTTVVEPEPGPEVTVTVPMPTPPAVVIAAPPKAPDPALMTPQGAGAGSILSGLMADPAATVPLEREQCQLMLNGNSIDHASVILEHRDSLPYDEAASLTVAAARTFCPVVLRHG